MLVCMLDRDALDAVLAHTDNDARLPVRLTCKAFAAVQETTRTAVSAMYTTPAMIDWVSKIDCPSPHRLSPHSARTVMKILSELESVARTHFVGTNVQMLRHPEESIRIIAMKTLTKLEPEASAEIAGVVAVMLMDSDAEVRVSAMEALASLDHAALTTHGAAIADTTTGSDHRVCVRLLWDLWALARSRHSTLG